MALSNKISIGCEKRNQCRDEQPKQPLHQKEHEAEEAESFDPGRKLS